MEFIKNKKIVKLIIFVISNILMTLLCWKLLPYGFYISILLLFYTIYKIIFNPTISVVKFLFLSLSCVIGSFMVKYSNEIQKGGYESIFNKIAIFSVIGNILVMLYRYKLTFKYVLTAIAYITTIFVLFTMKFKDWTIINPNKNLFLAYILTCIHITTTMIDFKNIGYISQTLILPMLISLNYHPQLVRYLCLTILILFVYLFPKDNIIHEYVIETTDDDYITQLFVSDYWNIGLCLVILLNNLFFFY